MLQAAFDHGSSAARGQRSALLSPEDSRRLARDLKSWSTADAERLHAIFVGLFAAWCSHWELDAMLPTRRADGGVRVLRGDAVPSAPDAAAQRTIAQQMFGDAPTLTREPLQTQRGHASLSAEIAEQAYDDWCSRVLQRMGLEVPGRAADGLRRFRVVPESAALRDPWSGRLSVAFAWGREEWVLYLDQESIERLLGHREADLSARPGLGKAASTTALVPVMTAVASLPVHVHAELTAVTLGLGDLQHLAIGDVIPLTQHLDDPAQLLLGNVAAAGQESHDTPPLCSAWLGQRNGRVAIELGRGAPT